MFRSDPADAVARPRREGEWTYVPFPTDRPTGTTQVWGSNSAMTKPLSGQSHAVLQANALSLSVFGACSSPDLLT